eukprot:259997_1
MEQNIPHFNCSINCSNTAQYWITTLIRSSMLISFLNVILKYPTINLWYTNNRLGIFCVLSVFLWFGSIVIFIGSVSLDSLHHSNTFNTAFPAYTSGNISF